MSDFPELSGIKTAACFFSAAFLGSNAERHVRDMGAEAVCVDTDAARLAAMQLAYPPSWHFRVGDAFTVLAEFRSLGLHFDLVTVDPFTNLMQRCFDLLPEWRALGEHVVLGISPERHFEAYQAGAKQIIVRTSQASWAVW